MVQFSMMLVGCIVAMCGHCTQKYFLSILFSSGFRLYFFSMKSFLTFMAPLVIVVLIASASYFIGSSKGYIETVYEQRIMSTVKIIEPTLVSITATTPTGNETNASGVIVTADGGIITSGHIVSAGARYETQLANGENVEVTLIPADNERDLAFFQIQSPDKHDYLYSALVDSQAFIQAGQQVLVFGTANGRETVIQGMISSLDESITAVSSRQLSGLMRLDAAVESGMSGGPTVLVNGTVVAINTAYAGANIGRGWATPVTSEDLGVFN
jgi:S1-C subfamily serine protease